MPDWIYCAVEPPVNAANTAILLAQQQAIWCPPQSRKAGVPGHGERLWLVWRPAGAPNPKQNVLLLGAGRVIHHAKGSLHKGNHLDQAAWVLGYRSPPNADFFIVGALASNQSGQFRQLNLGALYAGTNIIAAQQLATLQALLPIP